MPLDAPVTNVQRRPSAMRTSLPRFRARGLSNDGRPVYDAANHQSLTAPAVPEAPRPQARPDDGMRPGRPKGSTTMPKRTDISTVLIIGAGPIIIGQASEFDYS